MPNSCAICISGRPLDCNSATASRLNSSVKLRRCFVIKHPSCPFPERSKGVHQFGGGSLADATPERFRTLSARAALYLADDLTPASRIEWIFHLLSGNPECG